MKKTIIVIVLLIASPALAQQADYNIKVTSAELDTISEGLQTQPFGKVFPLMNKLREQIIAQQPKPAPAVTSGDVNKPSDAPK